MKKNIKSSLFVLMLLLFTICCLAIDVSEISYTRPEYRVALRAMNAPEIIQVNTYANFSVMLENSGTQPAHGYKINLKQVGNDIPLASTDGLYIKRGQYLHFFDWIPTEVGKYDIYGEIVWDKDKEGPRETVVIAVHVMSPELYSIVTEGLTNQNTFLKYSFNRHITQTIFPAKDLLIGTIHELNLEITIQGNRISPPGNSSPSTIPPGRDDITIEQGLNAPYSGKRIRFYMATTNKPALENHTDWLALDQFTLVYTELYDAYPEGFYKKNIVLNQPFEYNEGNIVIMTIKDDYSGFSWRQQDFMSGNQTLHWGISSLEQLKTVPVPVTLRGEMFGDPTTRIYLWRDFTSIQFIKLSFYIDD